MKASGGFAMKILALELSSAQRSVAVLQSGGEPETGPGKMEAVSQGMTAARHQAMRPQLQIHEVLETGAGGANIIGMIDAALGQAQVEREQIQCLVVGLGPGSYTGIRLAIAVAQGWQLAGRPGRTFFLGISSAEAIAAQVQENGRIGPLTVIIDAQRGEFYLQRFEINSAAWQPLEPLHLATREEVDQRASAGELLVGPAAGNFGGPILYPRAATAAKLALGRTDFVSTEQLQPIYLRETKFVKAPPSRKIPS